ncbi:isochorismatase family cysteine hydrolase [Metamycoplasma alkalescens]|uniref:Isochorismatase-like domain-containing protein n=1 Tax=Metamycoplasma alkalescens 14918 TaxID=1188234 RepID=N9SQL6_9BACT|nr:isochorismatase family cysteine hydrolase [Metamycoplasma alkalescens]ENY53750.1 Hypothetical protein, putative hydrolase of the Isochorismatase family [Metamycoplasma alkalescens 14918]
MQKIIFVIDMLNGFCNQGKLASKHIKKLVPSIEKFLSKNQDEEIIFICDQHSMNDIEMKSYPIHCLKNTKEAEIVDELKFFAKKIIGKNTTNSFFAFENKDFLEQYERFEIVGCCTDICILQFAINLKTYFNKKNLDKEIIVYKNLVDTFNTKKHNRKHFNKFALKLMQNSGIIIK